MINNRELFIEKVDSHKISNNAGSDFLTSLNSVPSTRGFKVAFLKYCQPNLDEIRYSMSSKHIDLIAFNETRLDSNLNNNMVHRSRIGQEVVVEFVSIYVTLSTIR